jgi:hypothetical protein
MILLNKLFSICAFIVLTQNALAQTPAAAPPPLQPENKAPTSATDANKNNAKSLESVDKIIIESGRDPEDLPKKKKTFEQLLESLLNPEPALSGTNKLGYRYECVKGCKGPFCCAWSAPARSFIGPDTEHK